MGQRLLADPETSWGSMDTGTSSQATSGMGCPGGEPWEWRAMYWAEFELHGQPLLQPPVSSRKREKAPNTSSGAWILPGAMKPCSLLQRLLQACSALAAWPQLGALGSVSRGGPAPIEGLMFSVPQSQCAATFFSQSLSDFCWL